MVTITRKNTTVSVAPEPPGLYSHIGYLHKLFQSKDEEWKALGQSSAGIFTTLPGFFHRIVTWLDGRNIPYEVVDKRKARILDTTQIDIESQRETGKLLIEGLNKKENGIIVGPCGVGKTHVIKAILESQNDTTLITTDDIGAATQLFDDLTKLLPHKKIGIWCSRKRTKPEKILITTNESIKAVDTNSIFEKAGLTLAKYNTWIADEVHTLPTPAILPYLAKIKANIRIGLTATLQRKDGAHLLLEGYFGPVLSTLSHSEGVEMGGVAPVNVCIFPVPYINSECRRLPADCTDWRITAYGMVHYRPLHHLITSIHNLLPKDGGHIIFAEWAKYCEILKKQIPGSESLHTKKGPAAVNQIKERIKSGNLQCVIATDLIQKSFNAPSIKYITMAALGSSAEKIQRAGRATRILEGKTNAQVHDFLHLQHPILFQASIKMLKVYEDLGWKPKIMAEAKDLISGGAQLGEHAQKLLQLEKYCIC